MTAAERKQADAYAGPNHSFPLYSSGAHLRAAWNLAGHASNPAAVRARIRAFAAKHGLTKLLPMTAQKAGSRPGQTARDLLNLAYLHEQSEGDTPEKRRLFQFAQEHGMLASLPEAAHNDMHALGFPHDHGDGKTEHTHLVKKARNVVVKGTTIQKAWDNGDGTATIEGWVSTEDPDQERDIVPPEAFSSALTEYAARRMPLSSEHQMKALPIGHGQRLALVRDGRVFAEATHPTDPAAFEYFPASGTGLYGRYLVTEAAHAAQVHKGNIGGFSWVGNLKEYEPLPTGGRRYVTVAPLLESTLAAYPVNSKAVLLAAKAYEADLPADDMGRVPEEPNEMDELLEALLKGAEDALRAEQAPVAAPVAAAPDAEAVAKAMSDRLAALVDERVAKALAESREGVGRKGGAGADPREADPAAYIVKKAADAAKAGEELSLDDKQLVYGIMREYITRGMVDSEDEE